MSSTLDEHRLYLSDTVRLDAFERALRELIRPGDVVLDLGAGTGVMSFLACRSGAARVYAVESSPLIADAERIAHLNGFADRIVFINERSTTATLPEPVDLVVSDLLGPLGCEVGLPECFEDAARRFLKPTGCLVPGEVELWGAPLEDSSLTGAIDFWNTVRGVDFSALQERAASSGYARKVRCTNLLSPGGKVTQFRLGIDAPELIRGDVTYRVTRNGTLNGIATWFRARLSPSTEITNDPCAQSPLTRKQMVFPCRHPANVAAGDSVRLTLTIRLLDVVIDWRIEVLSRDQRRVATSHGNTFDGMLLTADEIAAADPGRRPSLTPWGCARRSVVELCDGRTLREIEDAVFERHRNLFASRVSASAFVVNVLRDYAN